jgi:patatin-like phospholipase/acyl hydrolase
MAANNPSLCAISYAINQGLSRFEDIAVLSIGTGDTTEPFSAEEIAEGGLLGWLGRIVSVFMAGQADVNSRVCEQLMGGWERKRYLRLQFELNQKFDNTKNVNPNAPYKQLDKAEQKNEFIQKKLSEAMDDASPDNINLLIAATAAFLEQGRCYKTRNSPGIPVREAIRTFILESSRSQ